MISFLNLTRQKKKLIAVAVDLLLLPLAFYLAIWVRYDGVDAYLLRHYALFLFAAPIIAIPIFIKLGLYRAVIRFIDHKIVYVVVLGVSISVVSLVALAAFTRTEGYSRGVFLIYWTAAVLYIMGSRFLARGFLLRNSANSGANVAIYGAGQAGTQLASALRAGSEYLPVAFIDDDRELRNATIGGVRVFPSSELPRLLVKYNLKEIFVAMPALTKA